MSPHQCVAVLTTSKTTRSLGWYLVVFLKREKATPTVSIGIFPTAGSGTLGQAF